MDDDVLKDVFNNDVIMINRSIMVAMRVLHSVFGRCAKTWCVRQTRGA